MTETGLAEPKNLRERREIVADTAKRAIERQDLEKEGRKKWAYEESGLVYGAYPLNETFQGVIPEGHHDIKEYLEAILAEKKGSAIGLELGGTATQLFAEFQRGFFQRSAGVSLTDNRDRIDPGLSNVAESINHSVILGDMFTDATKQQVTEKFLRGQKADVIFERAIAGQNFYPRDADFMGKQANFWYQQLADNGVMFLTTPTAIKSDYLKPWAEMISDQYAGQIELQIDEDTDAVRIRRLLGAPEQLPLIDQREQFRSSLQDKKIQASGKMMVDPNHKR